MLLIGAFFMMAKINIDTSESNGCDWSGSWIVSELNDCLQLLQRGVDIVNSNILISVLRTVDTLWKLSVCVCVCVWYMRCNEVNPLMGTGNYSAHRIIWSWYTGRWWMGCYIWYSDEGPGRAGAPPSLLLAEPNVTAHPSTASVPTSYYSMCTIIPCAH